MKSLGSWDTLLCETQEGVATLTLNRGDKLNVMNMRMRDELHECLVRVREDREVRVLIITGAGDAFCAGGDMNDFVDRSAEQMHAVIRDKSHPWFDALWRLPKPAIAAVNGVAAGGGINMVLACDFVLASENARFGETFVKVGLMPDLGGLFLLPRSIGLHRAKALCLTGDLINAEQALKLGFVHDVVAPAELTMAAIELAEKLANGPADVYASIKATLNRSFELSMEEMLHFELYAQSYLFGTSEYVSRMNTFLGSDRTDGHGEGS
jgi:2-(1,2-epoxy-1,2-dihydrophenyl)acetyl-CoA isomerase